MERYERQKKELVLARVLGSRKKKKKGPFTLNLVESIMVMKVLLHRDRTPNVWTTLVMDLAKLTRLPHNRLLLQVRETFAVLRRRLLRAKPTLLLRT